MLDSITFEVLSHRLTTINDETALTIRLVSPSPVANQVFDFNSCLMTTDGDAFTVGNYIVSHAVAIPTITKNVISEYKENPGIFEGDMFLCNDPYTGSPHQTCSTVVAPTFWKGEIVSWSGATVHVIDVGGPVEGQVAFGAQSIFAEQRVTTPVKIVEKGRIRKDIEKSYVSQTRLPELLSLDLRAKIASNNVARERIHEVIAQYGLEQYLDTLNELISLSERRLRSRLKEFPDGTWRHRTYLNYDPGDGEQRIYTVDLEMKKQNDSLTFDFSKSDEQAPAVINMTRPTLLGAVLMAVFPYLCWDIPHCPTGVERAYDVISKAGTLVDCKWPAGCSKSTTTSLRAATVATSVTLAKMLVAADRMDRVISTSQADINIADVFGVDHDSKFFGTVLLDAMGGGMGARGFKDGIDTGGNFDSVTAGFPNVETMEARFPVLYLYRKQITDSGGAGKFRGGTTIGWAWVPHKGKLTGLILHCAAPEAAVSIGISGGYPSCVNQRYVKRNSNVKSLFREGKLPLDIDEISGQEETFPAISKTRLDDNDVLVMVCMGGGGFGDPLERSPELVLKDVKNDLVSLQYAKKIYGVVISPDMRLDERETQKARLEIRNRRKEKAGEYPKSFAGGPS